MSENFRCSILLLQLFVMCHSRVLLIEQINKDEPSNDTIHLKHDEDYLYDEEGVFCCRNVTLKPEECSFFPNGSMVVENRNWTVIRTHYIRRPNFVAVCFAYDSVEHRKYGKCAFLVIQSLTFALMHLARDARRYRLMFCMLMLANQAVAHVLYYIYILDPYMERMYFMSVSMVAFFHYCLFMSYSWIIALYTEFVVTRNIRDDIYSYDGEVLEIRKVGSVVGYVILIIVSISCFMFTITTLLPDKCDYKQSITLETFSMPIYAMTFINFLGYILQQLMPKPKFSRLSSPDISNAYTFLLWIYTGLFITWVFGMVITAYGLWHLWWMFTAANILLVVLNMMPLLLSFLKDKLFALQIAE